MPFSYGAFNDVDPRHIISAGYALSLIVIYVVWDRFPGYPVVAVIVPAALEVGWWDGAGSVVTLAVILAATSIGVLVRKSQGQAFSRVPRSFNQYMGFGTGLAAFWLVLGVAISSST